MNYYKKLFIIFSFSIGLIENFTFASCEKDTDINEATLSFAINALSINEEKNSSLCDTLLKLAEDSIDPTKKPADFSTNDLKEFIFSYFDYSTAFSQDYIKQAKEIAELCFKRENNTIGTVHFSMEDHANILFSIIKRQNFYDLSINYNLLVYRYYLIYGSMFPSQYDSYQIKEILETEDHLSEGVNCTNDISEALLEDVSFTIVDLFETGLIFKSFEEKPYELHKTWIECANILKELEGNNRSILVSFISWLPQSFSPNNPLEVLKVLSSNSEIMDCILNFKNFEFLESISFETEHNDHLKFLIKKILEEGKKVNFLREEENYDLIRRKLMTYKQEHNITQHILAQKLQVSDALLSLFLRGRINKSITIFNNIKTNDDEEIREILS
jgi:hypothetical protein